MENREICALTMLLAICVAFFIQSGHSLRSYNNTSPALLQDEIHGYHFHTYFFQTNEESTEEALTFRQAIQQQIDSGFLSNCRLKRVNMGPVGPHPIGSYETCCNKTSISQALTWFMENHRNLSSLLHPLTRFEVLDHTHRAMFLGMEIPLDVSVLSEDLANDVDLCLPLPTTTTTSTNDHSAAAAADDDENNIDVGSSSSEDATVFAGSLLSDHHNFNATIKTTFIGINLITY